DFTPASAASARRSRTGQASGVRNQESGIRSQESGVRGQNSEVRKGQAMAQMERRSRRKRLSQHLVHQPRLSISARVSRSESPSLWFAIGFARMIQLQPTPKFVFLLCVGQVQ